MKNKMTILERFMFILGWVRIEEITGMQLTIDNTDKELFMLKSELEQLKAKLTNPLPPKPPIIATSFPTKGEAERSGIFGNFISGIFGSMLSGALIEHNRTEIFKDEHITITICSGCSPDEMNCELNFTIDPSAKLILETVPAITDINLGCSKVTSRET